MKTMSTILIIEDEAAIRRVLKNIISEESDRYTLWRKLRRWT